MSHLSCQSCSLMLSPMPMVFILMSYGLQGECSIGPTDQVLMVCLPFSSLSCYLPKDWFFFKKPSQNGLKLRFANFLQIWLILDYLSQKVAWWPNLCLPYERVILALVSSSLSYSHLSKSSNIHKLNQNLSVCPFPPFPSYVSLCVQMDSCSMSLCECGPRGC